ncbi:aryl-sulfate sulfotransferase [Microbulbifer sp. SSSA007]|uniref:aryl-sulfate sulfotransferase n=1 Tax=Microbulbifer sp. SSSA007 TaxID=3243379 RepID=UPI00403985A5
MYKKNVLLKFFLLFYIFLSGFSRAEVSQADETTLGAVELILSPHPDNSLMVNASVVTASNARVAIRFNSADTERRRTAYTDFGTDHNRVVLGLRSDTTYQFTAVAVFESGENILSEAVEFKTGPQPTGVPEVNLLAKNEQGEGGLTIFAPSGNTGSTFWGFDEEGELVWYLHGDLPATGTKIARNLHDGRLLLLLSGEARTISFTGETLSSIELPPYHHDALLLENGHILLLSNETETINGTLLQGDAIIELDTQGNIVWEWSAFDHLDTGRFPGDLAARVLSNGALDWTHSNALHYIAEDDSILLSSRSQSWVVSIDHKSGEINWIMGRDSVVSKELSEKLFALDNGSWMASQHAAMKTGDGEILVYDNRNESELSGDIYNSRAVKFRLDTETMSAEQTWEFVAPKYTASLGDVDELIGGNILICAGGPGSASTGGDRNAHLIEVTSGDIPETAWEVEVVDTTIYRAERVSWAELLGRSSGNN